MPGPTRPVAGQPSELTLLIDSGPVVETRTSCRNGRLIRALVPTLSILGTVGSIASMAGVQSYGHATKWLILPVLLSLGSAIGGGIVGMGCANNDKECCYKEKTVNRVIGSAALLASGAVFMWSMANMILQIGGGVTEGEMIGLAFA